MTLFVYKRQHYIIWLKDNVHTRNHRKWGITGINEATCDRWFAAFCFSGKNINFLKLQIKVFNQGAAHLLHRISSGFLQETGISTNAAAPVPASIHCNITHTTLWFPVPEFVSPLYERWLPVSRKPHPVLILRPTPWNLRSAQAALWTMVKISCQFLFGRVWTRTQTVSLCAQQ